MPKRHTFVCILSLQYSLFLPVICQPIAPYLHWNLIGTSLEPDWNLIGTSLKDDYNISLLSISVLPSLAVFANSFLTKSHNRPGTGGLPSFLGAR